MEWITRYWIEWIFGVFAAVLVALFRSLKKRIEQEKSEQDAIKAGLQALLRAQMVNDYNHYVDKGFAPIYARETFESCYKEYKGLGGNGVMTDLHAKFMALPAHDAGGSSK